MLNISPQVFAVFDRQARSQWLEGAIVTAHQRHPEWCRQRELAEIRAVCAQIHDMSETYELTRPDSFEALLELVVQRDYHFRPTAFQHYLLSREGFTEVAAVARFCEDFRRGSRVQLMANTYYRAERGT